MIIDWTYVQANYDWLGHIVEGLVIALVMAVAARTYLRWPVAVLVGLAFAGGHFHGREKRDYEISADLAPPHLEGYALWRWTSDQMTDFWPVAGVVLAISLLVAWRYRP